MSEFRFPQISYIDYKLIEMDRTLLNLFPRLKHNGVTGRFKKRSFELTIDAFTQEFTDAKNSDKFIGFSDHKDIVRKWLETDLLDLVYRGDPNKEAVVSPRPLHGNTYKFRNADHARDYNTSEHIYWMIYHAQRGQDALQQLRNFLFTGLNAQDDKIEADPRIDVETQAILHLDAQVKEDHPESAKTIVSPLCLLQANLFAEDVLRLLSYENHIPRSVLVEYLKILFAFHLAIYHLRLLKLLPELVRRGNNGLSCHLQSCVLNPSTGKTTTSAPCPYPIGLVIDMGEPGNTHMLDLASRSADIHYRRIPNFIQAQFTVKQLNDFAEYLTQIKKQQKPLKGYFSVADLLQFQKTTHSKDREGYFASTLRDLTKKYKEDEKFTPEINNILEMYLSDFETCIEILIATRGQFYRNYITQCLDSLLLKNRDTGLLRQARGKDSRRFVMGSRLLEVLLQIAVLEVEGISFRTREIRVDDLLLFLRQRYGLYIDTLPPNEGLGRTSIIDQQALTRNKEAFKMRLREIGFFQDLSDAYITQTVTPRYTIHLGRPNGIHSGRVK
ncbi:MAG TPA: hypothetical protein VGL94_24560 [Ktedonobacteraceae bacterium]